MDAWEDFDDWVESPNIVGHPEVYELENEAIERDGRLDSALFEIAPWTDQVLLDLGCGTGFWLPTYAEKAQQVIGVEPDGRLHEIATNRCEAQSGIEVLAGSAERIPLLDSSVDIVHARFAYFFGEGCELGLEEVRRAVRPEGRLLVIDNDWGGGDFASLLGLATTGNAAIDPARTERWWSERGAERHQVQGGWVAKSRDELERILRIEFPDDVVSEFMAGHHSAELSYWFSVYELSL